jgi:3-methylfumaryl-CoA hydratase
MDVNHLRKWIGREERREVEVSETICVRFQATFGGFTAIDTNGSTPLGFHWCIADPPVLTSDVAADGHPSKGSFLPPVPLPRRMWAGGSLEFLKEIRSGDRVEVISQVADLSFKQGRTGPLCFVKVDREYRVRGSIAICERQDLVYRGLETGGSGRTIGSDPGSVKEYRALKSIEPSAVLLFRYSALTFNSHRIHYDLEYARVVEGYPGLVVHGPLQATLLLMTAQERLGRPVRQFSFRSVSPLFAGSAFDISEERASPHTVSLATRCASGHIAMAATASA